MQAQLHKLLGVNEKSMQEDLVKIYQEAEQRRKAEIEQKAEATIYAMMGRCAKRGADSVQDRIDQKNR